MRIIAYPPSKPEIEIECHHCKAILAYNEDDCFFKYGTSGDLKYIKCMNCNKEIILELIPYPKKVNMNWGKF